MHCEVDEYMTVETLPRRSALFIVKQGVLNLYHTNDCLPSDPGTVS